MRKTALNSLKQLKTEYSNKRTNQCINGNFSLLVQIKAKMAKTALNSLKLRVFSKNITKQPNSN